MENKGHLKHLAQINKMRMMIFFVFLQPIFGILSSCCLSANLGVVTSYQVEHSSFMFHSFIFENQPHLWFNGQFL